MLRINKKETFMVSSNCTLKEALQKISHNVQQIVFVINSNGILKGSVTDGDICRFLEKSGKLTDKIQDCMCKKPKIVYKGTPRHKILQLFVQKIHAIPELDKSGHLISIITADNYHFPKARKITVCAKAPARISFAGGGTDLTHYFNQRTGIVLNTTIKKFSHAILTKREDSRIIIYSGDYDIREDYKDISKLQYHGRLKLLKSIIKLLNPSFGFELITYSDFPSGSGLGGSASTAAAVIECFSKFREDELSRHEIAELAFQAERIELSILGGWQDQYATVFGGFNFIEFSKEDINVHPLRLNADILNELESNLLLCYTGQSRASGEIHKTLIRDFNKNQRAILSMMERSKEIANEIKNCLLRGQLKKFAELLDEGWNLKNKYSKKISNRQINALYKYAIGHGARAGKLLGAGGGGYFIFYADSFNKIQLKKALMDKKYHTESIVFDNEGLQSWIIKKDL